MAFGAELGQPIVSTSVVHIAQQWVVLFQRTLYNDVRGNKQYYECNWETLL